MNMFQICNLKQIKKKFKYSVVEQTFVNAMPDLKGYEWAGSLKRPPWNWGDGKTRDNLKTSIAEKLEVIQGTNCAFCGMKLNVTSARQIEHIAPKGAGRYPEYMFYENNLVLACGLCNGFEKKERKEFCNTIGSVRGSCYETEPFNIVHPKLDDPKDHYDLGIDEDNITISHKSLKGQKSIAMLKLDQEPHTSERFKMLLKETYNSTPRFKALADEIFNP